MPLFLLGLLITLALIILGCLLYWRSRQRKSHDKILRHLDNIRQHEVLIKPDRQSNTYSGRFAGRLLRFSFNRTVEIQTKVNADLKADEMWIYPVNYRALTDGLKSKLEKNRSWVGNKNFDSQYMIASQPRHLSHGVIYPAHSVQAKLLTYSQCVVTMSEDGVILRPNLKYDELTADVWRDLMGLVSDIAEYTEEHYGKSMYSGIIVDENAYPDHTGGHVN